MAEARAHSHNLTLDEARARARLIRRPEYELDLGLLREDGFDSRTVVRFECTEPGASTFVDYSAAAVRSIELNGNRVPLEAYDGARITLDGLAARNELRVEADGRYSLTGKGLNRFRDPVDGNVYVHTDLEPFDAYRVYPCFDQPDLKGRFRFRVLVPEGWEAVSNARPVGPPEPAGGGVRWTFGPTLALPTYITALITGPYHVVRDRHRDIDLALYARRSLAEHLDPEEWFEVTKQGFDFFEEAFGYPYPFDKYDQLLVPEFAAGAMENAGCVTYNERYVFRSRVTRREREYRAGTILHEMAHMWFGDLVTMRWWNDLWLNESFASYAGVLAQVSATRFTEGWTVFADQEKTWALQQDQLPTTHPIVAEIPDVLSVHLNFDGITYAKGASVLRQLEAWVGLDRFLAGMKDYFKRHEFGNAELEHFLAALERSSGRDLGAWSREWLETPGVNTLRPELREDDGRISSLTVVQEASDEWPALRSHRIGVGLYDVDDGKVTRRRQMELDVVGARTEVAEVAGEPRPDLIIVNDDDLTFAKLRFDDRSLQTVRDRLGDLDDSLARALCWTACWDMVRDAEMAARDYLEVVLRHAAREGEVSLVERQLAQALAAIDRYGDPGNREAARDTMASAALERLRAAREASDQQLAWTRSFISAARSPEHVALARRLLDGSEVVEGLAVDTELRWQIVQALAASGAEDAEALIRAELERDPSDRGQRYAASARAGRPDPGAKAEAWGKIVDDRSLTRAVTRALMRGFQRPGQQELLRPYVERYFDALLDVWEERELEFALDFGEEMYPRWIVDRSTIDRTDEYLGRRDVPGPVRRLLLEGRHGVERALRARDADAAWAPPD